MNCKWKTHYAGSALALAITASLAPAAAHAQTPPTAPAPAAAPAEPAPGLTAEASADVAVDAPALPEVPPALPPPPPPPPPADEKPLFRWYGFVKPTVIAGNGLESFGNPNYSAVTAAANPVFLANPDSMGLSFQVAQTRLGLAVGEGTPVKGQIEIDFIDFGKSSPAQLAIPRLRQAFVEWTPKAGHKLTMGQLWDMFSPLNTHSYNWVGTLFQSGNTGFMRHQIYYTGMYGNIEAGLAVGMTTQNGTPALNNVEYGRVPTFTARVAYKKDKTMNVGVSAIATRISFNAPTAAEEHTMAAAGNLFADLTFGALNLRAEAYAGQNLNNLGALSLAQAHLDAAGDVENVAEVGGWVSGKYSLNDANAVHLIVGGAAVLDDDKMALGYTPGTPAAGMAAAVAPTRVGANGPGIINNMSVRLGYAYSPYKGFQLVGEPFFILTKHKLDPAAAAVYDETRKGYGIELGGIYSF